MNDFISGALSFNFTADPGSGSDPGLQVKFGSMPTASVQLLGLGHQVWKGVYPLLPALLK